MKQIKDKIINLLRSERYCGLVQFVKFGIVGLSNTMISYGIDILCYYVLLRNVGWQENTKIAVTSVLAFLISVTNSYYWNNKYVFRGKHKKSMSEHIRTYVKTTGCYALTGLILSPLLKLWLNGTGIKYWLASIISLIITVPINYFMNKFWAYRPTSSHDSI